MQRLVTSAVALATATLPASIGCLSAPADPAPADAAVGPDAGPGTLLHGLIAWYPMETLPGDDLVDEAGDHDGTCVTCPSITSDATVGAGAIDFAGGEHIQVDADSASEFATPAGTIALWVRLADSDRHTFISWPRSSSANVWMLWSIAGGAWFQAGDNQLVTVVTEPDVWMHLAGTWRDDGIATLYVDGNESAEAVNSMDFSEATDILIGAANDGGLDHYHVGSLDDLRIYDRALSKAEIEELVALGN